ANFEDFLLVLGKEFADELALQSVKLVLETLQPDRDPVLTRLGEVLVTAEPEFCRAYLTLGRDMPVRRVTLRQVTPESDIIYGERTGWIRSEACLLLALGPRRLPGMLVLGS